ncbi:SDR family NAD(P)-dependent oxidoreductase [Microbacterium album]|uniref:Short-chain dehydrogenase n=1 Tax=Microbacterium album TaxID=2053191 RepID=A0A917IIC7_9MICO|nr:SDR family NAD(P)-dependent oxidoreductase [Microbacterium album]GGH48786.1 short-chain dehydrogenase [Microbacterium album]
MTESKTIVITGASDGIGAAAARRLSSDGHRVVVVGRSPQKTAAVAREIGADHFLADFTELEQVRSLADELKAAYPRIDVLANNAGGVFGDPTKTVDGFERTFQINHLAPFLLTRLLMDTLVESRASVIQTSSTLQFAREIDLDDLDHDKNFSPVRAYTAAKLENVLFTTELHRRFGARGISAASFYPGNVASSFGAQSESTLMRFIATNPITRRLMLISPDRGADTLVWLAEAEPGRDWEPGRYFSKRKPITPQNRQALDADLARRFWDRSEQLLGL